MKKSPLKILLFIIVGIVFYQLGASYFSQVYSLDLDDVSVTISNSRPSFRANLSGAHAADTSVLTIDGTQNAEFSTSSAQLVQGDTVTVGTGITMQEDITVASTSSITTINLAAVLTSGKSDGDEVISTQSSDLTIRFKTSSAVNGGKFRFLVPAFPDDNLDSDGIPDGGYFDIGGDTGTTVSVPSSPPSGYSFTTCTTSRVTLNGADYHSFTCPYTGTGAIDADFTTTDTLFTINDIINPAPKIGHTTGTADTYSVIVQQLDGSDNVEDQTITKIGVIEAVRVTATVAPQISFKIIGVPYNTSVCGITTDVTTTPATVPFGELAIDEFTDAAQGLSVTTNAVDGYTVTAIANDQLGREGVDCSDDDTTSTNCIQDSRGDSTAMSHTASDEWSTNSNKGFAYALHDSNDTTTEAFSYNFNTDGLCPVGTCTDCDGSFCARQFADAEDSGNQVAQTIFSDTVPSDNDNLYVCYRIIPKVTTAAGFYENYITYTATGTF